MTALRFALGVTACILLPAAIAGAVAGLLYDRLIANHDHYAGDIADEVQSWLESGATA